MAWKDIVKKFKDIFEILVSHIKEFKVNGIIWWYYLWPFKWGAFLRGTYNQDTVPFEFCEIVVYRSILCQDCVKEGNCINCGCNMPDAIMDLENFCSGGNWDPESIENWKEYKKRTGLKFNIEYKE